MRRPALTMILMYFMFVFSLTSCAVQQATVEPIDVTGNPGELVSQLDSQIIAGRQNQLNVLSPTLFAKAEENLQAAKQGLKRGDEIAGILERVAMARAQLKSATENTKVARTVLPAAIKAREDARTAGATIFETDYAKAEEGFLDLTRAIENDNLKSAQRNQDRVVENLRSMELRAIKEKTLGEVRDTIALATQEGAKKLAPELLAASTKELQAVDTFISNNPYEKEAMLKKAGAALFNAQRLLAISRQSAKLQGISPEGIALWVEGMLGQVTSRLGAPDMRNQSFSTQIANIVGTVDALQSDRKFIGEQVRTDQSKMESLQSNYETQIAELNTKIAALEGTSKEKLATEARLAAEKQAVEQRLAAERKFNQLYNEVQNYFASDEAEVYKQGNQLVIRMSGIKFPVGKAIIMPENYALLSKVQQAVRTFGDPNVVVEGHTDSTGTAATNEHLSQQRAEAVKEYLVANQTLPAEHITALGFGSIRPLASNATPEGRAINRRIDVIISPITGNVK